MCCSSDTNRIRPHIGIRRIEDFQILSTADDLDEFAQLIKDMPHLLSLDMQ
jgi:hypothetical protein